MNNEEVVQNSSITISGNIESFKKKKVKWSKFQPIAIFLGIGLLTFILYEVGFKTVLKTISQIGWGFLIIIALNGFRHSLRSFCIYLAVPKGNHSFNFTDAITTRLAGEAVGVLTFTGMMASETTKTALLRRKLSLQDSLSTIVVDNLVYDVSVMIFILSGAFLMIDAFANGGQTLNWVLIGVIILMVFGLIGFILMCAYKFKPMTYLLKHFGEKKLFPKFIYRRRHYFLELETDVLRFYENHRSKFYILLGINILGHLISVTEVYTAFYLLGFQPSVSTSYIIESLTKVVNFAFSFIPGNLGIYEGGSAVIFVALGYTAAAGVALALVRRGSTLFWTFIGLLILIRRGLAKILSKPELESE